MLLTVLKEKLNSKEWWQDRFVELVADTVMLIFGFIFVCIFKVYIM